MSFTNTVDVHHLRTLNYVTLMSLLRHKLVRPIRCYYWLQEAKTMGCWSDLQQHNAQTDFSKNRLLSSKTQKEHARSQHGNFISVLSFLENESRLKTKTRRYGNKHSFGKRTNVLLKTKLDSRPELTRQWRTPKLVIEQNPTRYAGHSKYGYECGKTLKQIREERKIRGKWGSKTKVCAGRGCNTV